MESGSLTSNYHHGFIPFDAGDYPAILSPDGSMMARFGIGLNIAKVGKTEVEKLPRLDVSTTIGSAVSFSPNNSYLAARSSTPAWSVGISARSKLWDADLDYVLNQERVQPEFSPDSRTVASCVVIMPSFGKSALVKGSVRFASLRLCHLYLSAPTARRWQWCGRWGHSALVLEVNIILHIVCQ